MPVSLDNIATQLDRVENLLLSRQSGWRTVSEAAKYICVSRRTIQRYLKEGTLKSHLTPSGIIRINQNDIDAWVMFGVPFRKLTRPQKDQLRELCRWLENLCPKELIVIRFVVNNPQKYCHQVW